MNFELLDRGQITYKTKSLSTAYTLPVSLAGVVGATSTGTVNSGDTVSILAPPMYNEFYFDHWECTTDATIHNATSPYIQKGYTCATVNNLEIVAVYGRRTKDTIVVTDSGSSVGSVIVHGFVDSLGGGVYTVYRGSENYLLLEAIGGPEFNKWDAAGLSFNNSAIAIARFDPGVTYRDVGRRWDVGGDFGPGIFGCLQYTLDVYADGGNFNKEPRRTPDYPINIATILPVLAPAYWPYGETVNINNGAPFAQIVSVNVTNTCYQIQYVAVDNRIVAGSAFGAPAGDSWSMSILVSNPLCQRVVNIYFSHKVYRLTSEIASADGGVVNTNITKIIRNPTGFEIQGWKIVSPDVWSRIDEYKCSTSVQCTPVITPVNGVGTKTVAVGWETANPYTSTVLDAPTQKLTFIMDQDRIIRHKWKTNAFLATQIGFYSYSPTDDAMSGGVAWRWFNIDEAGIVQNQQDLSFIYSEFQTSAPNQTIFVRLQFNKNVKESSLAGNFFAKDTDRDDFNGTHHYYDVWLTSNNVAQLKFTPADGVLIWCLGHHLIRWTSGIKSEGTLELDLENPGRATSQVAPPLVKVEFDEIEVLNDVNFGCFLFWCEDPDPELTTWAGMGTFTPREKIVLPGASVAVFEHSCYNNAKGEAPLRGND